MKLSGWKALRSSATLGAALLWANDAYAQKIPVEAVWSAGVGLLAPFVAIPLKVGLVRFSNADAETFRPGSLSVIEWVLWFPVAFVFLRSSDSNLLPVALPALFALSIWLHKSRGANVSWAFAIVLSFLTPVLAIALPLLAFGAIAWFQSLSA